ncbi:MAG TPA: NAD+ synthase, partial [Euryarchaeota archaeon]|nr:NAD+ synthase [Euryarchaeota archaeon]
MKITIAQMNPIVGDIEGNMLKIKEALDKNVSDLVVFPELFLTGYPPRDLLKRSEFIKKTQDALKEIIRFSRKYPKTGILFGTILPNEKDYGRGLYNSAVLVCNGKVLIEQHKSRLSEARYFDPAPEINTFPFKDEILGISICEDAWNDSSKGLDPIEILAKKGATLFINISASPFSIGKEEIRYKLIRNHALKHK